MPTSTGTAKCQRACCQHHESKPGEFGGYCRKANGGAALKAPRCKVAVTIQAIPATAGVAPTIDAFAMPCIVPLAFDLATLVDCSPIVLPSPGGHRPPPDDLPVTLQRLVI
ncbi:MAG: hypothetical protein K8T25_04720 [Planctomycetia bacterium]|nr:hypothetical protein [Planctomycetia bacterium]